MTGMMMPTWLLSMWISNTAATAMMIPIAEAVIEQLKYGVQRVKQSSNSNGNRGTANNITCY